MAATLNPNKSQRSSHPEKDRNHYLALGLCLLFLLILTGFCMVIESPELRAQIIDENGPVEVASALGYFLCLGALIYWARGRFLWKYHPFMLLILFFGLRELDFDKKFTTMGIFKSRFYSSETVPIIEKAMGVFVIALLAYAALTLLIKHFRTFLKGLRDLQFISVSIALTFALLVLAKSIDGIGRKLKPLGIDLSSHMATHSETIEEIAELGIPMVILITISSYFKGTNTQNPSTPIEKEST